MEAGYDGLTAAQLARFNELMGMRMRDWPDDLYAFVRAGRPGCGDHIADLVGQWVKRNTAAKGGN